MLVKPGIAKAAVIACLAALVVPVHAEDASWDTVVAAAKKEGKVVVYNMTLGAPYFKEVLKSFETKYGITVSIHIFTPRLCAACASRSSAQPRPRDAAAPGPRDSMKKSAWLASWRSTCRPASQPRSTARPRLFAANVAGERGRRIQIR